MTTDEKLVNAIIESLHQDSRIHDADAIAVAADHGIVTLRGTVNSFGERVAADEDAHRFDGTYTVDNRLHVEPSVIGRRSDRDLRAAALQALVDDKQLPADSIHVSVHEGWVRLHGNVRYQSQSNAAYNDVEPLDGVRGVTNELRVNPE